MSPVSLFLLTIAAIFVIGVVGEVVFERTGIPDVVWLIVVGIILGPLSQLVEREALTRVAPYFGALTLVVVLFDGGSKLRLKELSQAATRGMIIALLTFVCSVATLAVASMGAAWVGILPESWSWLHGIILGAILGGPSSVVIMPALAKAGIRPSLSNVINLESALTDVLCVVVTAAAVQVAAAGSADLGQSMGTLGRAFGIGLGVGLGTGLMALLALRGLKRSVHAYPLILGTLLIVYVIIDHLGGSAALGILAASVVVGNAPTLAKGLGLRKGVKLSAGVQSTHGQITFIIKSFFFTFIGTMLGPPWALLGLGVAFGVLLLGARIPAVLLGTVGSGLPKPARGLVGVTLPRGMAAGVLAMMPAQAGVSGTEQLPVVVFAAVFTTVIIFAGGFPVLRKKLAKAAPEMMEGGAPAAQKPTATNGDTQAPAEEKAAEESKALPTTGDSDNS